MVKTTRLIGHSASVSTRAGATLSHGGGWASWFSCGLTRVQVARTHPHLADACGAALRPGDGRDRTSRGVRRRPAR